LDTKNAALASGHGYTIVAPTFAESASLGWGIQCLRILRSGQSP